MVRMDCSCAAKVPSRLAEMPAGSAVAAITSRMSATTTATSRPPEVLASTTMRRRPPSRRIWFGPSVSVTSATCESGTQPEGVSISRPESPSVVRAASGRRTTTSKRRAPSTRRETTRPLESRSSASVTCAGWRP